MNQNISIIILIALFYYLAFFFLANKIALNRLYKNEELVEDYKKYVVIALNFNIIAALFITQDSVMNYFTFMIKEDQSFLTLLSSGSIIILINSVLVLISFFLAKLLVKLITSQKLIYLSPVIWIAVHITLLKLTNLLYETIITTQSYTIF
jgi:hypothetical protein